VSGKAGDRSKLAIPIFPRNFESAQALFGRGEALPTVRSALQHSEDR
jgi:hypothetical protein